MYYTQSSVIANIDVLGYNIRMLNNLNQFTILIILGIFAIIVEIIIGAATGFELLILGVLFIIGGGVGIKKSSKYWLGNPIFLHGFR